MALSRPTLVRLLSMLMSEISEECMCAGWEMGLEYTLWDVVLGRPIWSRWEDVTPEQREMLCELSQELGGWVIWNPDPKATGDTLFVPLDEWRKMYADYVAKKHGRPDTH